MRIPNYIKPGDTIGVTGTSNGVTDELKIRRFHNGVHNLKKLGYDVKFTNNVFTADERGCCSSGQERAGYFNELLEDESVSAIISPAGGDYLMEMLPYMDFDNIKQHPKWFQGYSDNTGLIFPIVTICDVAAVYGSGFGDFGMEKWHKSVQDHMAVLTGKQKIFHSYDAYEQIRHEYVTGYEGYYADEKVCWVNGRNESKIEMSGRLIGGCLDVIVFLLGTKYDGTKQFTEKYAKDGIIWVLESFAMNDILMITHLWQMKELGYFKNATGFVFGRPFMYNMCVGQDYQTAVISILGDLGVPLIFDADLGHKGPQLPWIMGAKSKIISENGNGILEYV